MRALRGGRMLVESLGIDPFRMRLRPSCWRPAVGAAGWLYAHMRPLRQPGAVRRRVGILYLLMAMVGGMGPSLGRRRRHHRHCSKNSIRTGCQDRLQRLGPGRGRGLRGALHPAATRARGLVPRLRYLPRGAA